MRLGIFANILQTSGSKTLRVAAEKLILACATPQSVVSASLWRETDDIGAPRGISTKTSRSRIFVHNIVDGLISPTWAWFRPTRDTFEVISYELVGCARVIHPIGPVSDNLLLSDYARLRFRISKLDFLR